MPTVLRVSGFRLIVLLPPREHGPAHVHVVKAEGLVVIRLTTDKHAQETLRVEDMKANDVVNAERIVREHNSDLLDAWRTYHDED